MRSFSRAVSWPESAERRQGIATAPLPISSKLVWSLIALGAAERLIWNVLRSMQGAGGEAVNVAHAVASGRGIADAFGPGTGPTAHVLPISPAIAGAAYAVLGNRSIVAEIVLASYAIILALTSYVVFDRLFSRLGVSRSARLVGFAFLCLAPTYIQQEAVDFRAWEGGLATLLFALLLHNILATDTQPAMLREDRLSIVLAAVLFLVQPMLGLAGAAALSLNWIRRCDLSGFLLRTGLLAVLIATLITPWMLRNDQVLGTPVMLRSNFGLELAIGEYPGELRPGDESASFLTRLRDVHPGQSEPALHAMRVAGGEVAYARQLQKTTMHWMREHPAMAVEIAAMHIEQIFLPPTWFFHVWAATPLAGFRSMLASMVGCLGLLGLISGVARRPREWLYIGIAVSITVVLFSPFQPVIRYTYLFYGLFTYCAADAVFRIAQFGGMRFSHDAITGARPSGGGDPVPPGR